MVKSLQREELNRKRLISNISHDLRTPLSNLNGYLEALKDGVITGDRDIFASLYEETQHLIRLVEQLHQLSVLDASPITEQEKSRSDISKLCRQVAQSFQLEFDKKGLNLHMEVQQREFPVYEQGIRQILTNLLANAVVYNTGNEVWIKGEVQGESYHISVTNIGEPIPQDIHDDVFERFVKADPARKRNEDQSGSGLGLAIVKEITKQHGGQVGLRSNGHKHTFWVALPLRG